MGSRSVEDRLFDRVRFPANWGGCWLWIGYKMSGGYGQIRAQSSRRTALVHRVTYELAFGQIPPGLQIDHLCRNRACVNPLHLEAVTQAENIRRGEGGINNRSKAQCPQGHPYDSANTWLRVTPDRQTRRTCRACLAAKARDRRLDQAICDGRARTPRIAGLCKNGHVVTGDNARILPRADGRTYKVCRACDNARSRERQRAIRARRRALSSPRGGS